MPALATSIEGTHLASDRFIPRYFDPDISSGLPTLTEEGRKALEEELKEAAEHQLPSA